MKKTLFITSLFVWHVMQIWAQGSQIERQIADVPPDQFTHVNLFTPKNTVSKNSTALQTYVSNFDLFEAEPTSLNNIATTNLGRLEIEIPLNGEQVTLQLIKSKVYDSQTLFTAQNGAQTEILNYTPGAYYSGIIKGYKNTLVAISFYSDNIIGVISNESGNFVLGKSNVDDNGSTEYILYNDKNLRVKPNAICATDDNIQLPMLPDLKAPSAFGSCVRVYIEADNQSYINHGSNVTNTVNWVLGIFNVTTTLYKNEAITTVVSQVKVWTTPDPYISGTNTGNTLPLFSSQMAGGFNGDLAHLFSSRSLGGGIAYINVLCASNNYKVAVSANLDSAIPPSFPTYSWNAMVVTHEMGHNLGSNHTHACVWNGNNTAIDGCAGSTSGGCPLPPNPPGGGTIMSYCHITSVGINFNLGFGPQPGNVIRNAVNSATCLTTCCPSNVTITGNYSTFLTESSTWIKSSNQTTIASTLYVKLDAHPTNGYVEFKPVAVTDFFLAAPSTNNASFTAQALDGCGPAVPFLPTGVEEDAINGTSVLNDLRLFPNPFNSTIHISFLLKEESKVGVSIKNIYGQEVGNFESQVYGTGDHSKELNVGDFAPGIYFCTITTGNSAVTAKIIKSN